MPEASKLTGIPPKISKNPVNKHRNGLPYHIRKGPQEKLSQNSEVPKINYMSILHYQDTIPAA